MKFSSPVSFFLGAAAYSATVLPSTLSFSPSRWGIKARESPVVLNQEEKRSFSLANLFSENGAASPSLRGNKGLEPHPSVRPHISPLNRLGPDEQKPLKSEALPLHSTVRAGTLPNGLPYVILPNKSPPGRFEAHLQVFSGSGKFLEEESN
jgi:hypothetical protein